MIQSKDLPAHERTPFPLGKSMLIGAAVGLVAISIFVFGADDQKPEWGSYWQVKPLLLTPAVGALCGFAFHIMECMHYHSGWNRVFTAVLSVVICIVGLWIGIVLGLNGTMWD